MEIFKKRFICNNLLAMKMQLGRAMYADWTKPYMVSNQAPQAWYSKLGSTICALQFIPSKVDTSLFIYKSATLIMYVLLYVDDLIIVSSSPAATDWLLQKLNIEFTIKDLGDLHFFSLELKFTQVQGG